MSLGVTAAILATLLAGVSLFWFGLVGPGLRLRGRQRLVAVAVPVAAVAADEDGAAHMAEHVVARVEGLLTAQTQAQADALADLKAEILGLKSDVEWLAGERMIEQAIALAQTGIEAEEIGRELGMSRDAAETIVAFRRH